MSSSASDCQPQRIQNIFVLRFCESGIRLTLCQEITRDPGTEPWLFHLRLTCYWNSVWKKAKQQLLDTPQICLASDLIQIFPTFSTFYNSRLHSCNSDIPDISWSCPEASHQRSSSAEFELFCKNQKPLPHLVCRFLNISTPSWTINPSSWWHFYHQRRNLCSKSHSWK